MAIQADLKLLGLEQSLVTQRVNADKLSSKPQRRQKDKKQHTFKRKKN